MTRGSKNGWLSILGLALSPLLLALSSCSGFGIQVDGGYAKMQMSGKVALSPNNSAINLGTIEVDVEKNLGLADEVATPYGRAEIAAGIASFTFSGFTMTQSADGTIPVSFGGISASANVHTDFDLTAVKGAVHFDLINLGVVRIAPGVGVDLMDIKWTVKESLTTTTENLDVLAPIPMLFVQSEVNLGNLSATLDVGGVDIDVGDVKGTFFDLEGVVRYTPTSMIEVFAGYRWISLDAEGTDQAQRYLADLSIQGWMVGVGIDV